MNKETLTIEGIRQDLQLVTSAQISNHHATGNAYFALYLAMLAALGAYFKNVWVELVGLIPIVVYWIIVKAKIYEPRRQRFYKEFMRADISISVERFSHISEEMIYEPHKRRLSRGGTTVAKQVFFYHFESGLNWREPAIREHYKWSREFCISPQGLKNISVGGNEFYFVSLQGDSTVSYIYPCKTFELDASLKESQEI